MRAIKIDPYTETITEVNLPEPHDYTEIYRQLGHGCDTFQVINLDDEGEGLFIDEEGLLKIKADAQSLKDGTITRFFILHDASGQPCYQIAGCGLLLGCDSEGNSIGTKVSLNTIKKAVRFISAANSIKAAQIATASLDIGGVCRNADELRACQLRQLALVAQAAKLTH